MSNVCASRSEHVLAKIMALEVSTKAVEPELVELAHTAVDQLPDPKCWRDARHSLIAAAATEHRRLVGVLMASFAKGHAELEDIKRHNQKARQRLVAATNPNWLAERPGRGRMPHAFKVAEYWAGSRRFSDIDLDQPACFACRRPARAWRDLERAHLCDRWLGGLDHAANLAMLCSTCHSGMPMFEINQGGLALDWVRPMRSNLPCIGHAGTVYAAILRRS